MSVDGRDGGVPVMFFSEYEEKFWKYNAHRLSENFALQFGKRTTLVRVFGFAVPNSEAIKEIATAPGPIVEIGAGLGYWASLVKERFGVEIECFDAEPPSPENRGGPYLFMGEPYVDVRKGNERSIRPDHKTLLLIWPGFDDPMAYDCLCRFRGDTLIYVGEGRGGCTGDDDLHTVLESEWEEVKQIEIPQFWGLHDALYVFKRR